MDPLVAERDALRAPGAVRRDRLDESAMFAPDGACIDDHRSMLRPPIRRGLARSQPTSAFSADKPEPEAGAASGDLFQRHRAAVLLGNVLHDREAKT